MSFEINETTVINDNKDFVNIVGIGSTFTNAGLGTNTTKLYGNASNLTGPKSGSWILLADVNAGNTNAVDFQNVFSSKYSSYILVVNNLRLRYQSTNTFDDLYMRIYDGGGTQYTSSVYYYNYVNTKRGSDGNMDATSKAWISSYTSTIRLNGRFSIYSTVEEQDSYLAIKFENPTSSNERHGIRSELYSINSNGTYGEIGCTDVMASVKNSSGNNFTMSGFRIYVLSGDTSGMYGRFKLYGIK